MNQRAAQRPFEAFQVLKTWKAWPWQKIPLSRATEKCYS